MTTTFEENYKRLNLEQKKAVDTIEGPVMVVAGPGTGKTQILTLRIANILKQGAAGIEPENILALTFTNAGSFAMKKRLGEFIGPSLASRVWIATFHSFIELLIKEKPLEFLKFSRGSLVNEIEQLRIIESLVKDVSYSKITADSFYVEGALARLLKDIAEAKKNGMTPDQLRAAIVLDYEHALVDESMFYKRNQGEFKKGDMKPAELRKAQDTRDRNLELADLYERYNEVMSLKNLYDFDDMIIESIKIIRENEDLKSELQERFQYIMVDEHQDTSEGQNAIVRMLLDHPMNEGRPNIFVVGDSKQSIYRFAGATRESFESLLGGFNNIVSIDLGTNYRSHQGIVDLGHSLITKSPYHKDALQLKGFNKEQGSIELREFSSESLELIYVAQAIEKLLQQGESPDEIAVLYTKNKHGDELQEVLMRYGIEFNNRAKKNLFEDFEMRKLLLLLRATLDTLDNPTLAHVLFIDFLNFDLFSVQKIIDSAKNARKRYKKNIFSLIQNQKYLKELDIDKQEIEKLTEFAKFLLIASRRANDEKLPDFFVWFVRESGFLKHITSIESGQELLKTTNYLFSMIKDQPRGIGKKMMTLADFMEHLNVMEHYNIKIPLNEFKQGGISLRTFHTSKGLEFNTVFIIKANQERKSNFYTKLPLPIVKGDEEDDRNALYVALTRAKKNLIITRSLVDSKERPTLPMNLLSDIDGLTQHDTTEFEKSCKNSLSIMYEQKVVPMHSIFEQHYIEERFLESKLAVTSLNNYFTSSLNYFFNNLLRLPNVKTASLIQGSFLHEVLDRFFKASIEAGEVLGEDELREIFYEVFSSSEEYAEFETKGWKILSEYFEYHMKDFQLPESTEYKVYSVPFILYNGEQINLTGAIDKITREPDGSITVWDYKTGRSYDDFKNDKERVAKLKRQATFYKKLLMEDKGGKLNPRTIKFDFIEKSKKKREFESITFEITDTDIQLLEDEINTLARDIFEGTLIQNGIDNPNTDKELLSLIKMISK